MVTILVTFVVLPGYMFLRFYLGEFHAIYIPDLMGPLIILVCYFLSAAIYLLWCHLRGEDIKKIEMAVIFIFFMIVCIAQLMGRLGELSAFVRDLRESYR